MPERGYVLLVGAAFFFSVMTVCVKLAGARLPAEQIILARAVIGLGLSAWAVRRSGLHPWGNATGLLLLRGVLGSAGLYCLFYAVTVLPLSEVTTIQYVNPVVTALLAAVLLGERVGRWLVVALAVSLSGVLVVARPQMVFGGAQTLDPTAVGIALLGATLAAGSYVTVRRLRQTDAPMVVVLWFPLVATPLFLPLALRVWVWPSPVEWLVLAGVGLSTQIAQVLLTRGLHLMPAGRGTAVGYVQIAFAMVWSVLLFDERVDAIELGGATLVVLGTAILLLTQPREPAVATAAERGTSSRS